MHHIHFSMKSGKKGLFFSGFRISDNHQIANIQPKIRRNRTSGTALIFTLSSSCLHAYSSKLFEIPVNLVFRMKLKSTGTLSLHVISSGTVNTFENRYDQFDRYYRGLNVYNGYLYRGLNVYNGYLSL